MVITNVEAHVVPEKAVAFEQSYRDETGRLPPEIVQSFLLRDTADPTLWRIVTHWRSREDLEKYRQSVETPTARRLFLDVGAEPSLAISDVVVHASP
jgi:quinol monooxygenase YgiN